MYLHDPIHVLYMWACVYVTNVCVKCIKTNQLHYCIAYELCHVNSAYQVLHFPSGASATHHSVKSTCTFMDETSSHWSSTTAWDYSLTLESCLSAVNLRMPRNNVLFDHMNLLLWKFHSIVHRCQYNNAVASTTWGKDMILKWQQKFNPCC